ncbi:hypothetical protein RCOM_0920680 [Ricinus communis]|uniref:Uncharacterized protein n=1 Tax=Ricinus communis TaxID=3988 RepID=B9RNT5_RICCO|nr:hypothetical protein RCOM_0920680 [Ricinus communis]
MRNKGQETAYAEVLEFFVAIDDSNSKCEREIPEEIGNLTGLQFLSLSTDIVTSKIPSSLGNLKELEALYHSMNNCREKATQLIDIYFLSFFSVS